MGTVFQLHKFKEWNARSEFGIFKVFMVKIRTDTRDRRKPRALANAILGDVHFWIPVIVLAGGMVVLRWVS